ncbi:MAG: hypothetical protein ACOCU6_00090 [Nanoarchaeota archaeon]
MTEPIRLKMIKELFDNPADGKMYTVDAYVEKVFRRDDGLNIFTVFDGTDYLKLTKFVPKTVAFPEIVRGSVVRFTFKTKYYEGNLEGTPVDALILEGSDHATFMKTFRGRLAKKFSPDRDSLIIESSSLEKLKDRFKSIASLIRQAVYEKRPILMTHHADCDGFSAGFLLETAISELISKVHPHERFADRLITRIPSRTPFYDVSDATRDIGFFMTANNRHGERPPLVLIVDNGSTLQDLLSIRKVKLFGADVAVIDHHDPGLLDENGQSKICKEVLEHVNPHLVGLSSYYSASLLSYIVSAYVIDTRPSLIPAILGAIADRSDVPELSLMIEQSGESRGYFESLALYVNYEIYLTRMNSSYSALKELVMSSPSRQKEIMNLYEDFFKRQEEDVKKSLQKYHVMERHGLYDVCLIDGEVLTFRGDYYSIGKIAGIAHDTVHSTNSKNAVTIVFSDGMFVFRAKQDMERFDVNTLITHLKERFPFARIDGGGHAAAGSVKMLPVASSDVLSEIKHYINNLR